MDVEDTIHADKKAANLAFLRNVIQDMESKDEMVEFSDELYEKSV